MKKKQIKEKPSQLGLGIKYKGSPFLQRVSLRYRRISRIMDQFSYWRSPVLWLAIFLNTSLSIITAVYFYNNITKIPSSIALFYYYQSPSKRFINSTNVILIVLTNLIVQLFAIIVGGRLYFKSKTLAYFIQTISIITTLALFISIYKPLSLVR
ncbi:hypothetical protein JW710_04465 [Candidatus Dojkabacteria bacterium]|nr:hypothetical protein [Candidatus Dojkabacteria bacterium]